jgi:predicted dehydrogenase
VIIAVPIEHHFSVAMDALNHGKHVFIEKPITMTAEEANILSDTAVKNNLIVAVEYTHQCSRSLIDIRRLINPDTVTFMELSSKHLGRFMEHDVYNLLASHCLSILSMWFDVSKLKYNFVDYVYNGDICTTGSIECYRDNKIIARIDTSINYYDKELYVNLYGDNYFAHFSPIEHPASTYIKYDKLYKALPLALINTKRCTDIDETNNLEYAVKYWHDVLTGDAQSNLKVAIDITTILELRNGYNNC